MRPIEPIYIYNYKGDCRITKFIKYVAVEVRIGENTKKEKDNLHLASLNFDQGQKSFTYVTVCA